jgi:hypothetical protein
MTPPLGKDPSSAVPPPSTASLVEAEGSATPGSHQRTVSYEAAPPVSGQENGADIPRPAAKIPGYEILEELGRGGMGPRLQAILKKHKKS